MDINQEEDNPEDVIESSQVPKLRSKIRLSRPNYTIIPDKKPKKRPPKRIHDNKTVSQCLRQVWKQPLKVSSPVATPKATIPSATTTKQQAAPEDPDECYIKFVTQQEPPPNVAALQATPSVSLFDDQERVLARYVLNENIETQVDEELQRLLDGFQEEYEKDCARLATSSALTGRPNEQQNDANNESSQLTCLPGEAVEPFPPERRATEPREVTPLLAADSDPFIMPNFSQEIAQLEKMMENDSPARPDVVTVPSTDTVPIVPIVEQREKLSTVTQEPPVPTVTENAYLDLSVQREKLEKVNRAPTAMSIDEECTKANPYRIAHVPPITTTTVPSNAYQYEDVLDLRISAPFKPPSKATATATASNRPTNPVHCGTQTDKPKRRNAGVQHRPVASFDFTEHNLLMLAQRTETDPVRLRRQLKNITKSANQPIWQERDLSAVFSMADPYYANLKHFL